LLVKWLIAVAVIALIGVGVVFVGGASPAIIVAPEQVFHWGPIDVTNTMFTSWFVVLFLVLLAVFVGPRLSVVPSGFSGAVEAAVEVFYNLVVQVAGEENGRRFFPLVATIFFFILTSNYFGLLPINNVIGLVEPNFGDKQAVMGQTTVAGIDLAYIPFTPDQVDVGGGDIPYVEYSDGTIVEFAHGDDAHAEDDGHDDSSRAIGATALVSSEPAGAAAQLAPGTEAAEPGEGAEVTGFSGLVAPYFRSVMTDVNAPLAIAIFSFIFVEFWGLQSLGIGYLSKFFSFGKLLKGDILGGVIDVFVGLLEFVSELSRMVSFTFRLFGNIFAGEVLLLMMTFLVPFVLVDVFYGLELFVGLIQAFVFAILTLVFAVTAVSHHGDDHGDEGAH
jgi:F-type H+-transporting ATPase subunit a